MRHGDIFAKVMETFGGDVASPTEVVATWVSGEPGTSCTVQHLTKGALEGFLRHVPQKGHGMLQKFVPPFGGKASLLRTDWSPHHQSVELRTNWYSTTDFKRPLAERLATFEGGVRHVSVAYELNHHLHATAERLNREIAACFNAHELEPCKVWRLQASWRPAADGRLCFGWGSRIETVPTDATGFLEDDAGEGLSDALTESVASSAAPRFRKPTALRKGVRVVADGSIFHIPLPGMASFEPPSWWREDELDGITNLLPSATAPRRAPTLGKVWRHEAVQRAIYPAEEGAPPPFPVLPPHPQAPRDAKPSPRASRGHLRHRDGPGSQSARSVRGSDGKSSLLAVPAKVATSARDRIESDTELTHSMPAASAEATGEAPPRRHTSSEVGVQQHKSQRAPQDDPEASALELPPLRPPLVVAVRESIPRDSGSDTADFTLPTLPRSMVRAASRHVEQQQGFYTPRAKMARAGSVRHWK
jgi:hypothetical protein